MPMACHYIEWNRYSIAQAFRSGAARWDTGSLARVNAICSVCMTRCITCSSQPLIHGDETTLQVLHAAPRHAQSKSYMWAYRSAEPSAEPVVLFDYQLSRAQHHPQAFLNGYTGKLISDGYLAW